MPNAKLCQLILLITVAACTTQPKKVASNDGPDVQCHTDQTTGSMIGKSVCTTRAERALQQSQIDDLRHAIQTGAAVAPPEAR
jgi:hypothetical protein